MVVAVNVSVKIRLKVKRANCVVDAINTPLDSAPQGLTGIDVSLAANILLGRVPDNLMGIAKFLHAIIAIQLIRKNHCFALLGYLTLNKGQESSSLDIRDDLSDSLAITLHHAHDNGFLGGTTATLAALSLTADIGFINLYLTTKRADTFGHQFANLPEDAPRCLVSDAEFTLKLLGRNTSLSRGHQKDGVKPRAERGIRLVEDSASRRRNAVAAELTGVELSGNLLAVLCYRPAIVLGYLATLLAEHAIRITAFEKELKAGIIGRELGFKVFDSVGFHLSYSALCYTINIAQILRSVKGYLR